MNRLNHLLVPLLAAVCGLFVCSGPSGASAALPQGVAADGITDDTAALQAALDKAGRTGEALDLPPGCYLVTGALNVPAGVAVCGSWRAPHDPKMWQKGTTILLTGGKGREDGPAAITLNQSSSLTGVTLGWPDQQWDAPIPYPWAVKCFGDNTSVENVSFINAYQGVETHSACHVIRNIFGTVLRRGIFVDQIHDIGRIENVHFNSGYWILSGLGTIKEHIPAAATIVPGFTTKNLEAFLFGNADWEYVLNTFVWGARVGYRFIRTPSGDANGQFTGIGADCCDIAVLVDSLQGPGIQITNGEFTAFANPTNVGVLVGPNVHGPVEFVNCTFWDTPRGAARLQADTQVVFSGCHFVHRGDPAVIVAERGRLSVAACSFRERGTAIALGQNVAAAVLTGNLQPGGLSVDNRIGARAKVLLNESQRSFDPAQLRHYRIKIGASGDDDFIKDGWYGPEATQPGEGYGTARWTNGDAELTLPVVPGHAYVASVTLLTRPNTPPATVAAGNGRAATVAGVLKTVTIALPESLTKGRKAVSVRIAGKTWKPSSVMPGNGDSRDLNARVYQVEVREVAKKSGDAVDLN